MARPLRIEYPGAIYHILSRGDRREAIFRTEADRKIARVSSYHFVVAVGRAKEAESSVKFWETTLAMLAARS